MGDGGVGQRPLLNRVAVEASQGGQPPGDGGAAPPSLRKLVDVGLVRKMSVATQAECQWRLLWSADHGS
jgi:hypothetical protein